MNPNEIPIWDEGMQVIEVKKYKYLVEWILEFCISHFECRIKNISLQYCTAIGKS